MSSQTKPSRSSHRSSTSTVPMSIFNTQVIGEVGKTKSTASDKSTPTGSAHEGLYKSSGHSRKSHHRAVSVSVNPATGDIQVQKMRRSMSTHQTSKYLYTDYYARPVGPELVCIKQPSCTGLPPTWTSIHDRFIAYLATHAPLDRNGRVQRREESRERWRGEDIARLVMERFRELDGLIKVCMVENRLALLDEAGDNDYFKMPYGAYKYEKWGRGV
ncbi:hypothetical protein VTL71DRAFT_2529 [Oculimacula yallundae]|uniref:Uncharacterized protein n=1 Tax=Oculimacula yallundae TaxID=86028 RepID=A0ABR4CBE0_9HELO